MGVPASQKPFVGQNVRRRDGDAKVRGEATYVDDLRPNDVLHGVTVRSTIPRGELLGVEFDPTFDWRDVVVVTAKDIPGRNVVTLIESDQPFLVQTHINHLHEPILLLAHSDKQVAERARQHVRIKTRALAPVLNMDDAARTNETIGGKGNIFKTYALDKGDADRIFGQPDVVIVEGSYSTGAQEQLYIEPQGVIAEYSDDTGVTVSGSMQCPYYVHKALVPLLSLAPDKVRIIQTETGGGFGGKEEYPSIIAGHAALLAMKARRPVKIIYDRAEDMAATTKRHPSHTRHRTALSRDGRLQAMDIDFRLDGGAYATLSAVVLSRGTIHAAGPYLCPNVKIRSTVFATNSPPYGAFRGFGAPQSIFALERHLDRCAEAVGLAPDELRRRNFLKPGDLTATHQVVNDPIDMNAVLDKAKREIDYDAKRKRFDAHNQTLSPLKKGIGLASFFHGSGFTGSGEVYLASRARVGITPQNRVSVFASSTEIGQGTNTIFSQIVADALGVDIADVDVVTPDTAQVPNSGPTVASRTVMIVGKLVERACAALRAALVEAGLPHNAQREALFAAAQTYRNAGGTLSREIEYEPPNDVHWDDKTYRGDAYATFAWAVYAAEVTIDMRTYQVSVDDFVAVQEVGKVMHPTLAAGQIEGGVAQGIGFGISEKVVLVDGAMRNNQMTNYIMPTAMDLPPIRVFFMETASPFGPGGAKGIGELPLDGAAPAVIGAMEQALGRPITSIPFMPEDVFAQVSHAV